VFPFAAQLLVQTLYRGPHERGGKGAAQRHGKGQLAVFEKVVTSLTITCPRTIFKFKDKARHRTSPTNMGLYLLSCAAAQALGFLEPDEMARRMESTVSVMERLAKWEGHFYNWYDTRTLEPLKPSYVSSVDSGNLAACLLCCAQAVRTLAPYWMPCGAFPFGWMRWPWPWT
jgi:hypothetical protein